MEGGKRWGLLRVPAGVCRQVRPGTTMETMWEHDDKVEGDGAQGVCNEVPSHFLFTAPLKSTLQSAFQPPAPEEGGWLPQAGWVEYGTTLERWVG